MLGYSTIPSLDETTLGPATDAGGAKLRRFDYPGPPRVVFGEGAEGQVGDLMADAGAARVLLVASRRHPEGADRTGEMLGNRMADRFWLDGPQVPRETVDAATSVARACGADWILCHGGGSAVGVAKAVALAVDVRIAAVPTTYAGSEMTDIWGITADGLKTTGRAERVRPSLVIYDPRLVAQLRPEVARNSLYNAMAHAVEALYSPDPGIRQMAEESAASLMRGLLSGDASDSLYGAMRSGQVLGQTAMALHHKLAHVLGGTFGLPHAQTHAALLPYTTAYNLPHAPLALDALCRVMGHPDPAWMLWNTARDLDIPTSIGTLGFSSRDVDVAVDQVFAKQYANPRPITKAGVRALLLNAMSGDPPMPGRP